jgi:Papain family cysteine protease
MMIATRLIVAALLAIPSAAVAQERSVPAVQTAILARTTWTAVRPSPASIAAVVPNGVNIPAADLRPTIARLGLRIRDQGNRGTCSVHAMTFLLEYMSAVRRNRHYGDLAEEYLNAVANAASGKTDDGDFFAILDQGYRGYGIVRERQFPYQPRYRSGLSPSAQLVSAGKATLGQDRLIARFIKPWDRHIGASDAQVLEVLKLLKRNVPVAVGMWWPVAGAFQTTAVAGVNIVTDLGKVPSGSLKDGHSVVLVGYAQHGQFPGGGYFIFRNSFGPTWGDQGHGYVSFQYLHKYANDLVAYIPIEEAVANIYQAGNQ